MATAERRHATVANARLVAAIAALGVGVAAYGYHLVAPVWLWLPIAAFAALVVVHVPVLRGKRRAERALAFYQRGLRRLDERWVEDAPRTDVGADKNHLYARDFDLFGRGSLFQRLATLHTRTGEETLAQWLLAPPKPAIGRARQDAVKELTPLLDAREALALVAESGAQVSATTLARWGEAPAVGLGGAGTLTALVLVALSSAVTATAWLGLDQSPKPFLIVVMIVLAVTRLFKARVVRATATLAEPLAELKALVPVLLSLERAELRCPPLKALQQRVRSDQSLASRAIASLARRVDWFESRRNQLFAPIAYLLLWEPLLAFAFEAWRKAHGRSLRHWLEAAGEFEALHALAAYAYERPEDVFAEIVDDGPVFEASGLGHPLLPLDRCVRNDVQLGQSPRLLLISGSNMSGKSTLLRAVGCNALLALMGAPVRAERLRMSWCSLGATLRVEDSLQDGASRFFAEVQRLKQLCDLAHDAPPLLFMLDEIMGGTNSHDRRVGTEALLRVLLDRGAFGLVTTHDLALTEIADALGPAASNVHFEDQMVDERLAFDYKMRPGVVQKSNALALMRAAGLDLGKP